jgi:hypothetical protein
MPTLHTLDGSAWGWGDMLLFPGGTIFSIDADGYMTLAYGKPVKVSTNGIFTGNDDGSSNQCVQIAMAHLGLPVPTEQVTHAGLAELLKVFEVIEWDFTVGDFIDAHRTGSYFVSSYDGGNGTHAWALIDGTAFNITFQTLARHIRRCWRVHGRSYFITEETKRDQETSTSP